MVTGVIVVPPEVAISPVPVVPANADNRPVTESTGFPEMPSPFVMLKPEVVENVRFATVFAAVLAMNPFPTDSKDADVPFKAIRN